MPPEHPVFPMGKQSSVTIVGRDDLPRTVNVDVARPKDIQSCARLPRKTVRSLHRVAKVA
jgi:hypothetical protein